MGYLKMSFGLVIPSLPLNPTQEAFYDSPFSKFIRYVPVTGTTDLAKTFPNAWFISVDSFYHHDVRAFFIHNKPKNNYIAHNIYPNFDTHGEFVAGGQFQVVQGTDSMWIQHIAGETYEQYVPVMTTSPVATETTIIDGEKISRDVLFHTYTSNAFSSYQIYTLRSGQLDRITNFPSVIINGPLMSVAYDIADNFYPKAMNVDLSEKVTLAVANYACQYTTLGQSAANTYPRIIRKIAADIIGGAMNEGFEMRAAAALKIELTEHNNFAIPYEVRLTGYYLARKYTRVIPSARTLSVLSKGRRILASITSHSSMIQGAQSVRSIIGCLQKTKESGDSVYCYTRRATDDREPPWAWSPKEWKEKLSLNNEHNVFSITSLTTVIVAFMIGFLVLPHTISSPTSAKYTYANVLPKLLDMFQDYMVDMRTSLSRFALKVISFFITRFTVFLISYVLWNYIDKSRLPRWVPISLTIINAIAPFILMIDGEMYRYLAPHYPELLALEMIYVNAAVIYYAGPGKLVLKHNPWENVTMSRNTISWGFWKGGSTTQGYVGNRSNTSHYGNILAIQNVLITPAFRKATKIDSGYVNPNVKMVSKHTTLLRGETPAAVFSEVCARAEHKSDFLEEGPKTYAHTVAATLCTKRTTQTLALTSPSNALAALLGRQFGCKAKPNKEELGKFMEFSRKLIDTRLAKLDKGAIERMIRQWCHRPVANYIAEEIAIEKRPAYMAGYQKAIQHGYIPSSYNMMQKPGELNMGIATDAKTRCIANPSNQLKALGSYVGRLMLMIAKQAYPEIVHGLNGSQMEAKIQAAIDKIKDPHLLSYDMSAFDSTQSQELLKVDNYFVDSIWPWIEKYLPFTKKLRIRLHKIIVSTVMSINFQVGRKTIAKFKATGTVFSGSPTRTTLGNCIRAAHYLLYVAHLSGRNIHDTSDIQAFVQGDDSLLLTSGKTEEAIKTALNTVSFDTRPAEEAEKGLGLIIKTSDYLKNRAEFLSKDIFLTENNEVFVIRKLARLQATASCFLRNLRPSLAVKLRQLCYTATAGDYPIKNMPKIELTEEEETDLMELASEPSLKKMLIYTKMIDQDFMEILMGIKPHKPAGTRVEKAHKKVPTSRVAKMLYDVDGSRKLLSRYLHAYSNAGTTVPLVYLGLPCDSMCFSGDFTS